MSTADIAEAFEPGQWKFTPDVVDVFDDHVRASVPFYDAIQQAVAEVADWLAPDQSTVVDLGASTGTTIAAIVERQGERNRRFHLYDESPEMIAAAKAKLDGRPNMSFHTMALEDGFPHNDASLTLALFTLQFLGPRERADVLWNAREASARDGAILIAEKVRATDSRWAEIATEVSWDYKTHRGISADSVLAKARALRGVLRPQTDQSNLAELEAAGWVGAQVLFRWHQWSLYGAFAS